MNRNFLKDYSYYLKIERAMSQNTVASYCSDVEKFLAKSDKDPLQMVSSDIETYLSCLDKVTKRSQARILSSLRSFYGWLVLEGVLEDNPCDAVDSPKLGQYLPDVLSIDEVEDIIESVDTSTWMGLRDKAILEMLYGCGLRVSEVVDLKVSGLYFKEGLVRVVGKGDKERLVPLGEMASGAVKDYLDSLPCIADSKSDDCLFLNRFGRKLSRQSVFKMIVRQARITGNEKKISPHTFRHSFATHLIENGADLRDVQEMLGHENVTTTEIYTHIDSTTWQKKVLEHHPRKEL